MVPMKNLSAAVLPASSAGVRAAASEAAAAVGVAALRAWAFALAGIAVANLLVWLDLTLFPDGSTTATLLDNAAGLLIKVQAREP